MQSGGTTASIRRPAGTATAQVDGAFESGRIGAAREFASLSRERHCFEGTRASARRVAAGDKGPRFGVRKQPFD